MMLDEPHVCRGGTVTLRFHVTEDTAFDARKRAWHLAEDMLGTEITDRTVVAEPVRAVDEDHTLYEVVVSGSVGEQTESEIKNADG